MAFFERINIHIFLYWRRNFVGKCTYVCFGIYRFVGFMGSYLFKHRKKKKKEERGSEFLYRKFLKVLILKLFLTNMSYKSNMD